MELHRFFRYAIEKMCKEKKSLNHFYILFGLTKYKKVCFLNFGFNLRYFLGVIKYLYDYFSKKYQTWLGCVKILQSSEILVKN